MKLRLNPASERFLRTSSFLVLAAVLLFVGYYMYANVLNRPTADVYIAQRGTAIAAVYGTVTIQPVYQLTLSSQNSGYLHIAPELGTIVTSQGIIVKQDQLLATITDEANTRLLTQARTDFEAAQARKRLGPSSQELYLSAKAKLDAYNRLPDRRSIPSVEYEAAKNEVARLKSQVDNEQLELQRQVDTTTALVNSYQDQLKHADVRAPIDGIVTAQNYNNNAFVSINAPLFTIAAKQMYVSGQVNEEDVGKLKEGMKAEMRLYAYGATGFTATMTAVLPSPNESSRYFVTLNFDNPPDNLRIGLTGEMNIILGKKENALIIPTRALLVDQLLIIEDGVVAQRTVKVGFKSLEFAEIIGGLEEGAQVIVADQDAFRTGERVRPVKINVAAAEPKPESKKKSNK
jgi:RND family efflux transporter MFP subunit